MKKRIISILLVMVIILTMTACVTNNDTHATTSQVTTNAIIEVATTEATTIPEEEHKCKIELLNNSEYDSDSIILKMTPEEISDYLAKMVNVSAGEDLCYRDINRIGLNFSEIWRLNSSACNRAEFETQATAIFDNVFDYIVEEQIPLEAIGRWTNIPVADVLCKLYSLETVDYPNNPYLIASCLDELTEEDAIRVAKVYFENPVFAATSDFATYLLHCHPNGTAADMAWEHLIAVSKSSDSTLSRDTTTYFTCLDIFRRYPELLCNTEKVNEIAENILQNTHYNFVEKYVYLCSDFTNKVAYEDPHDMDKEINDIAYESLLELAQTANEENYELIAQTVIELYDKYDIDSEVVDKLLDNYDVELLTNCLVSWKEVANTRLPRYY